MSTPETPGPEPEFDPESARIKLEIKKQIKETLALSPLWKDMDHEKQEQLAEDLFYRMWAIFLGQYNREQKARELEPVESNQTT